MEKYLHVGDRNFINNFKAMSTVIIYLIKRLYPKGTLFFVLVLSLKKIVKIPHFPYLVVFTLKLKFNFIYPLSKNLYKFDDYTSNPVLFLLSSLSHFFVFGGINFNLFFISLSLYCITSLEVVCSIYILFAIILNILDTSSFLCLSKSGKSEDTLSLDSV